jgi:iron complex outermembrane recepter protein
MTVDPLPRSSGNHTTDACRAIAAHGSKSGRCAILACYAGGLLCAALALPATARTATEFADLSIEELAKIPVISVSKKFEPLAGAPAAVFVITADDIRRAGATTLPEALRLAPNLQVARANARNYAISARGFGNVFSNKLLVLIDGRTVYSPLFSGVFWDAQDVVLEDIARIEVISGAGATVWGANAVNGVINIITRPAEETQGTLAAAGAGSHETGGVLRYGGALANGGHYRVYGKHADYGDTQTASGANAFDGWRRDQAGFRSDWANGIDRLTLQGDTYEGSLHQAGTADIRIAGANLLGRITRTLDNDAQLRVRAYVDHTERNQPNAFVEHLDTVDLEFQHMLHPLHANEVSWGGGYRIGFDRVRNGSNFAFLPGSLDLHTGNLFAQDEIALRDDLRLTLGMKLENNNYTGTERLPSARLAWKPDSRRLIWGGASRAVRAPSRIDRDLYAPSNPAVVGGVPQYLFAGGSDFQSEVVNAYEIGYRAQPRQTLSYSVTAFYDQYDRLRTISPNPAGPGFVIANGAEGSTHGIELWGSWQAMPAWRLSGGLVAQRQDLRLKPGVTDIGGTTALASSDASNYWLLRSSHDFDGNKELDLTLRHVGALRSPAVPAYTSLDARIGWKVSPALELSIVGQNLLDASHPEFGSAASRSEFERGVFMKAVWRL